MFFPDSVFFFSSQQFLVHWSTTPRYEFNNSMTCSLPIYKEASCKLKIVSINVCERLYLLSIEKNRGKTSTTQGSGFSLWHSSQQKSQLFLQVRLLYYSQFILSRSVSQFLRNHLQKVIYSSTFATTMPTGELHYARAEGYSQMDLQRKLWLKNMFYNFSTLYIAVIERGVQKTASQQLKITEVPCIVQLCGEFPKLRDSKSASHSTQLCKLSLEELLNISIQMVMTDPFGL